MKITIFEPKFLTPKHYSFSPLVFVKSAARVFARQGDEVFVLCQGVDKVKEMDGYTIYPLGGDIVPFRALFPNMRQSIPDILPVYSPWAVSRAAKLTKQIRPDVIYTCGTVFPSVFTALLQKNTGVPAVHHVFFWPSRRWWWSATIDGYHTPRLYAARQAVKNAFHELAKPKFAAGWGLRHVAGVIASSAYLQNKLLKFGLKEGNIPVVYPGVEVPQITDVPNASGPSILYLGHLWQGRGVLDLAEAFAIVVKQIPQCKLVVAPTDVNPLSRDYFLQIIEKHNLSASIEWKGIVNNVYADLLAPADVVVLPYRNDASIKLIEAMAAEKAIVTTKIDWIPELITDGVNGCLVAPGDNEQLAVRLVELLKDAPLRKRIAKNAHETAIQKCGLDVAAGNIRDVFQRVLAAESASLK